MIMETTKSQSKQLNFKGGHRQDGVSTPSEQSISGSEPPSQQQQVNVLSAAAVAAWCMDSLEHGAGADFKRTNDNQPQNSIN